MSKKLLLFPFGGNAKEALISVFAINSIRPEWDIVGFLDDDHSVHGRDYCGIKVLGGRELLNAYEGAYVLAVPGSPRGYLRRRTIIDGLFLDKSRFATILHPSVVRAPDATIGYNTLLMAHVVVSCGSRIGNHCIVLPNTVLAHDSGISDYGCIGSNVSISGSVCIGSECYIGSGVKIRENIRIGERSLVGLGSNVISDIERETVAVGNPARAIMSCFSNDS
ncbi:MAG: NeuD/PglB/VioB family sugar acetyltransferase [Nitrospira sp.]|nr:NeuD/PglB/VioB family sugar acetyltransferase [Nitrospira sp.]